MSPRMHRKEPLGALTDQEPAGTATDALISGELPAASGAQGWLAEEMARRDRETADVLQAELDARAGGGVAGPWLAAQLAAREDLAAEK